MLVLDRYESVSCLEFLRLSLKSINQSRDIIYMYVDLYKWCSEDSRESRQSAAWHVREIPSWSLAAVFASLPNLM